MNESRLIIHNGSFVLCVLHVQRNRHETELVQMLKEKGVLRAERRKECPVS